MNNLQAQPTCCTLQAPLNVTQPTESSLVKKHIHEAEINIATTYLAAHYE
jgi:predicted XRE-type DNA-binding protein